jgi:hypothetical protein
MYWATFWAIFFTNSSVRPELISSSQLARKNTQMYMQEKKNSFLKANYLFFFHFL